MKTKNTMENSPAQQDSIMSNFASMGERVDESMGKTENKTCPVQRGSKNSKLDFPLCLAGCQASPAMRDDSVVKAVQRDSGISNLRVLGILRSLRILGGQAKIEMCSAQQDSGMSILRMGEHCHTESAEHTEKEILTKNIKNIKGYFMGSRGNEPMSKMQNSPAQRYSGMSNLKIETENGSPQRHSIMSNGRLSVLLCCPHGQRAMSTMQIKNIAGCFGRLSVLLCWPHGQQTKKRPAQQDSGISILKTSPCRPYCPYSPYSPYSPLAFKTTPAQQDSKMSKGRLSVVLCWPHRQKAENAFRSTGLRKLQFRTIVSSVV